MAGSKHSIRPISKELSEKAEKELNENPHRIEETLKSLREWLNKQPHLRIRTEDQHLLTFLRGCKWSLQKTKQKIDYFYTLKTLVPDFFSDRDPLSDEIQAALRARIFSLIPNGKGSIESKTFILKANEAALEIPPNVVAKVLFMLFDMLMQEDDNSVISGFQMIADLKVVTPKYILRITPAFIKKFTICFEKMYPLRMKRYVALNVPKAVEILYNNVVKPFLSDKLKRRITLLSEGSLTETLGSDIYSRLTKECGGGNPFESYLPDQFSQKLASYRDWFLEDGIYGCDESRRPHSPKTYDQEFGMEGSFRKLDLD